MTITNLVPDDAEDRLDRLFATTLAGSPEAADYLQMKSELRRLRRLAKAVVPVAEAQALRAVLAPFAEKYDPRHDLRDTPEMQQFADRNTITPSMTMGDFRRAWEALGHFDKQRHDALLDA